jgi:hypothetical protein
MVARAQALLSLRRFLRPNSREKKGLHYFSVLRILVLGSWTAVLGGDALMIDGGLMADQSLPTREGR